MAVGLALQVFCSDTGGCGIREQILHFGPIRGAFLMTLPLGVVDYSDAPECTCWGHLKHLHPKENGWLIINQAAITSVVSGTSQAITRVTLTRCASGIQSLMKNIFTIFLCIFSDLKCQGQFVIWSIVDNGRKT